MMSQSPSDDETLMTVKQSTPSRVRFAEEGPSTVQAAPVTTITPTTDTTATSPSVELKLSNGQPDNQGRDLERDSRLHFDGQ